MNYLGLDLSLTATGWATMNTAGGYNVGTFGDNTTDHGPDT